jgi:hypothetical protein
MRASDSSAERLSTWSPRTDSLPVGHFVKRFVGGTLHHEGSVVDEVLDNITLYWLTATATSAARLYWESWDKDWGMTKVDIPVGCSIFPGEIYRAPQVWARRAFSNLFYWNELDRGGHFAAYEQPRLFVNEMRACFGTIR